jgi:hypothetical protein
MSFSGSAADERVLDVQLTDDTLTVSLRDGRAILVPLVWYPRLLNASRAAPQLEGGWRWLRHPLAGDRRRPEYRETSSWRPGAESLGFRAIAAYKSPYFAFAAIGWIRSNASSARRKASSTLAQIFSLPTTSSNSA